MVPSELEGFAADSLVPRLQSSGRDDLDLDTEKVLEVAHESDVVEHRCVRLEIAEEIDVAPGTCLATHHRPEDSDSLRLPGACQLEDPPAFKHHLGQGHGAIVPDGLSINSVGTPLTRWTFWTVSQIRTVSQTTSEEVDVLTRKVGRGNPRRTVCPSCR